ncbi:MAG: radical SAM protein [Planctomycetaceae bacterium]
MTGNARSRPYRVTIVHPCVGRYPGMQRYIRTWMMEPLSAATVAALLPINVERQFYDDRLEPIPFDEPTDLIAISVETYTARRAYQIASEYRRRGVPVLMGGFHATLCPEEVLEYCDAIVIGEAESVMPAVIDDFMHGRNEVIYRSEGRPVLTLRPDRTIFQGKKYLPIRLVEFARGCRFKCDFCAIQSFFKSTHSHQSIENVLQEIHETRRRGQMFFFIDDNLTSNPEQAKEMMRALIPLRIRWVSQSAINIAYDEEALELMKRSGCQGILVGFESLDPTALRQMNKDFNLMKGGPAEAMRNFRRHGLRIYGTFIFGYDHDTPETFRETMDFAKHEGLFIAAFNHITPFPGTPLYERMKHEGRLLYNPWWNDERYRYNMIPFQPAQMTAEELAARCVAARREFYSWNSICRRATHRVNYRDPWMLLNFLAINAMHQRDVEGRNGLPLGDQNWHGQLMKVQRMKPADVLLRESLRDTLPV